MNVPENVYIPSECPDKPIPAPPTRVLSISEGSSSNSSTSAFPTKPVPKPPIPDQRSQSQLPLPAAAQPQHQTIIVRQSSNPHDVQVTQCPTGKLAKTSSASNLFEPVQYILDSENDVQLIEPQSVVENTFHSASHIKDSFKPTADSFDEFCTNEFLGQAYIDPSVQTVQWMRISEILKSSNPLKLVDEKPSHFDIVTGISKSNSVFHTILHSLVNSPLFDWQKVIPNHEKQELENKNSLNSKSWYKFRFWKWNCDKNCFDWIQVWVDDRVPVIVDSNTNDIKGTLYSSPHLKENGIVFWVALLEKAWAKIQGSYMYLNYCNAAEILMELTSGNCLEYWINSFGLKFEDTWKYLTEFRKMGYPVLCIDKQPNNNIVSPQGLVLNQYYVVTECKTFEPSGGTKKGYKKKTYQLIRLVDPSNTTQWKGSWSISSFEWISLNQKERNKLSCDTPNAFWVDLEDFIYNFGAFLICQMIYSPSFFGKSMSVSSLQECWSDQNCGGNLSYPSWIKNPQFALTTNEPQYITICLSQQECMKDDNILRKLPYKSIGFHVIQTESNRNIRIDHIYHVVHRQVYLNRRDNCVSVLLDVGRYVIIPSTFKPSRQLELMAPGQKVQGSNVDHNFEDEQYSSRYFMLRVSSYSKHEFEKLDRVDVPRGGLFSKKRTAMLSVEVVEGLNLKNVATLGTASPYCEISIKGCGEFRTKTAPSTVDPKWNQGYLFFIPNPENCKLKAQIFNEGILLHTFMGQGKVRIAALMRVNHNTQHSQIWVPLGPRKTEKDKSFGGAILLRLFLQLLA